MKCTFSSQFSLPTFVIFWHVSRYSKHDTWKFISLYLMFFYEGLLYIIPYSFIFFFFFPAGIIYFSISLPLPSWWKHFFFLYLFFISFLIFFLLRFQSSFFFHYSVLLYLRYFSPPGQTLANRIATQLRRIEILSSSSLPLVFHWPNSKRTLAEN